MGHDYGVSYDALNLPFDVSPQQVASDLETFKSYCITSIYFTCNETDLADDRKLSLVLAEGHKLGLRVYVDPYVGGAFSDDEGGSGAQYLAIHPEDMMVSRFGNTQNRPSYSSQALREYVKQEVAAFLRYDFDGLLLDEPWIQFPVDLWPGTLTPLAPGDYYPYDTAAQQDFARLFGHPMPDTENSEVVSYRGSSIVSFLRDVFDYAHALRPDTTNALVVIPEVDDGPNALDDPKGTRGWRALAEIPSLDVLQIDPYAVYYRLDDAWVAWNIDRLRSEASRPGIKTGVWVQAYGLQDPSEYAVIPRDLGYAQSHGVAWLAAWVTQTMRNVDDAAVWRAIASVFSGAQ